MTKIFNFALKIKGVVGRVAHAKSSDPATPPKNLERAQNMLESYDSAIELRSNGNQALRASPVKR